MSALLPGLCSVTLRAASVDAVARVAGECGLRAVEWGADVHVPPGDLAAARHAARVSDAAGLGWRSYGSYLFADAHCDTDAITRTLDTALALEAVHVRVWAPFGVEPRRPETAEVAARLDAIGHEAEQRGLLVSVEHHGGTPTATMSGTRALLDQVRSPAVLGSWQPPYWLPPRAPGRDVADVGVLAERLGTVHVYEWDGPDRRLPLAEGARRWQEVLGALRGQDAPWAAGRPLLLEFVPDDDVAALRRDAATLLAWIAASEDGA